MTGKGINRVREGGGGGRGDESVFSHNACCSPDSATAAAGANQAILIGFRGGTSLQLVGSGATPAYRLGVQGRRQLTDGGSAVAPAYRCGIQERRQLTDGGFRGGASLQMRGSGAALDTYGGKEEHGFGLNMKVQRCCYS